MTASISKVFIANRGEIAQRILRAAHSLGIETVVGVSEADRDPELTQLADRVVCIGPAAAGASYLRQDAVLAAALGVGADALHPGYGFLAENDQFAQACTDAHVTFIGPRPETIRDMGNKVIARQRASEQGVPLLPGSDRIGDFRDVAKIVKKIGLPVLLKAAAGGGGRGIRVVDDMDRLRDSFQSATAEALAAFGDGTLYVERFVARARHIEVQIFADRDGKTIHLGERDCSIQRRFQKIIEEAPAPTISAETRESIRRCAVELTASIGYENAGTVEFLYDEDRDEYFFLEMNTRIQVEHPVTEAVTGLDLVQMQFAVAEGRPLPLEQAEVEFSGHAIECRITAEAARRGFSPSPGTITRWKPPSGPGIRVDSHCYEGYVVTPFYDSMLAKLVVHGPDREQAIERLKAALRNFEIAGIDTNIEFLSFVVDHDDFRHGRCDTSWVEAHMDEYRAGFTDTVDSAEEAN